MITIDIISGRRSIRHFADKKIPSEILKSIFEAGLDAPSPKNRQPWVYIVISDCKEKKRFSEKMRTEIMELHYAKPERKDILQALDTLKPIEECDVLVLVCYRNDTVVIHEDNVDWDISAKDVEALELMSLGASVENMLLKAQSLGVGSLWCGDILYAYQFLKSYSDLPIVSAICFGYSDYISVKPIRKKINEVFQFIKTY